MRKWANNRSKYDYLKPPYSSSEAFHRQFSRYPQDSLSSIVTVNTGLA
ncbi:hypothetical protein H6G91_38600 [Nostoc muscorum FACHB-395]|nr:hypothetical protein [Desmonostoc muscorum FACHB-395]